MIANRFVRALFIFIGSGIIFLISILLFGLGFYYCMFLPFNYLVDNYNFANMKGIELRQSNTNELIEGAQYLFLRFVTFGVQTLMLATCHMIHGMIMILIINNGFSRPTGLEKSITKCTRTELIIITSQIGTFICGHFFLAQDMKLYWLISLLITPFILAIGINMIYPDSSISN
jgi:hypothetical protein